MAVSKYGYLRSHRRSHLAARLSAAAAGLGAAFAVVAVVLLALSGTAIASFGADAAHLTMKVRIANHEAGAEVASVRTVPAELDTLSHHLDHVATQAGGGTVFALTHAINTSLNARLKQGFVRLTCRHYLTPKAMNSI